MPYTYQPGGSGGADPAPHESFFGHLFNRSVSNLIDMTIKSPIGFYNLGSGLIHDPGGTAKLVGQSIATDISHPLRNPLFTVGDVLLLGGGYGAVAGRLGEAGAVASAAERAAEASRAAEAGVRSANPFVRRSFQAPQFVSNVEPLDLNRLTKLENLTTARGATPGEAAAAQGRAQAMRDEYDRATRAERVVYERQTAAQKAEYDKESARLRSAHEYNIANQIRGARKSAEAGIYEGLRPTVEQALLWGPKAKARIIVAPQTESTRMFERGLPSTAETPAATALYGSYSKNPLIAAGQMQLEHLHQLYPNLRVPLVFRSQHARLMKAQMADNIFIRRGFRDLPARLVAKYKGLSDPEYVAARVVAEGVRIPTRIASHQTWMNEEGMTPRLRKETQQQINLLNEAKNYISEERVVNPISGEVHVLPKIKDGPEFEKLRGFVEDSRKLASMRERALLGAGELTNHSHPHDQEILAANGGEIPEDRLTASIINRRLGPHAVFNDTKLQRSPMQIEAELRSQMRLDQGRPEPSDRQIKLREELAHFQTVDPAREWLAQQTFRMPYSVRNPIMSLIGGTRTFKGAQPKIPGTLTHPFTGGILRKGTGRLDLHHVMAEDYLEQERFLYFSALRDRLERMAVSDPNLIDPRFRQQIRVRVPGGEKPPLNLKLADSLLGKNEMDMTAAEKAAGAKMWDSLRQWLMPESNPLPEGPGIKYVDRRLLGGLDRPNPLLSAYDFPAFQRVTNFFDKLNEAQKIAILYLKPAYVIPNLLSNVALGLVQQGPFLPANLYRSAKLSRTLDPVVKEAIQSGMGGGHMSILESARARGLIHKSSQWLSHKYGMLVDEPIRLSAFVHEARTEGYNSAKEITDLINSKDPKLADVRDRAFARANDAVINYERLGPAEQAVMRRLVFFYPWVKGSTRYAYQFATNHPVMAGLTTQAGKIGGEYQESILGPLPSFYESLIPLGGRDREGLTRTINPTSAAILGTSGDLVATAANLLSGHPDRALNAFKNLSPGDQALLTLGTAGALNVGGQYKGKNVLERAALNLYGGIPLKTLSDYFRHGHPGSGKYYPQESLWQALSRFGVFGGLQPMPFNSDYANYAAYLAKTRG